MTTLVGVIGWPLTHTLSPAMHNAAFEALGMDWKYEAMPVPPDIVQLGLIEPQRHGFVGINVTIPHKETVTRFVKPDSIVRAVGAANTIDLRDNTATNTDVVGLMDDLAAHDIAVAGKNVLVLGAGGAARSAVYGLVQSGARVTVVNRTLERAQVMLANMAISANIRDVDVKTLDEAVELPVDLIINSTSAGMWPNVDDSPWIMGVPFPKGVTVYDMVYRPQKTLFMQQAEDAGGRAVGGLGMLVRQGAAGFKLWTDVEPPLDVMFDAVRKALSNG
ncbi:MAG: shikimate dehydrogenase [bacterium]|nr:shikimate dehydrogenase [bacterium]